MADQDGIVCCTIPGLADLAKIPLEDCERALERFQKPDKYSWSQDEEGRRIRIVEGGWFLINHAKYRALMSKEDQREKTRLRVQRFRDKVTKSNAGVTHANACNDIAEADTKAEAISQNRAPRTCSKHPEAGRTPRGGCWDCYQEKHSA